MSVEKEIETSLPAQYKPLSPWAYFGYTILFSIPVVGLILLIIFAVDSSNINRRNFARSYFCIYALTIILCIILAVTGGAAAIASSLNSAMLF